MAKTDISKKSILEYRENGLTAVEIAQKLKLTISDYLQICKLFGIKGKPKSGVRKKYNLIDDTQEKEELVEIK